MAASPELMAKARSRRSLKARMVDQRALRMTRMLLQQPLFASVPRAMVTGFCEVHLEPRSAGQVAAQRDCQRRRALLAGHRLLCPFEGRRAQISGCHDGPGRPPAAGLTALIRPAGADCTIATISRPGAR